MSGAAVAYLLAGIAGALSGPSALLLIGPAAAPLASAADRGARWLADLVQSMLAPLRRAGSAGHDPSAHERIRLRVGGAVAGGCAGWVVGGGAFAAAAAVAAAIALPRAATARRLRYGRRVEAGAGAAALAIAGALTGGGSIRTAIAAAGHELEGPIGLELRRAGMELAAGASLETALDSLLARAPSRSMRLIAAALALQRRSGGDAAALLRRIAAALEDERRTAAEASAATAQARVTSAMVIALPPAGLMLAELAAPGLLGRMLGSQVGASLVALALGLQVAGALIVRRLAHLEP